MVLPLPLRTRSTCQPSIRETYSAGIPVVTYDSDFDERELAKAARDQKSLYQAPFQCRVREGLRGES